MFSSGAASSSEAAVQPLAAPAGAVASNSLERRCLEPQKWLPVAFVCLTMLGLYIIYMSCHIVPMLQLGASALDQAMRRRGAAEMAVFHLVTCMLLICYACSVFTHPGSIPDNDPLWEPLPLDQAAQATDPMSMQEMKKTGERRHCKWCGKYKPDRCHHCRVCKSCILKMDHHCPWIYNCVGFKNYKYFFLLLVYSVLDCHFIVWTMAESVKKCLFRPDIPLETMFWTFFGETVAFFLATLTTIFLAFHVLLMLKAMTTIEFCEKSLPKKDSEKWSAYSASVYDQGLLGNMRAVLGNNVFLWFLPCSVPQGDGLNFVSDETRLSKDLEFGKGIRRKTHQKTQRHERRCYNPSELMLGGSRSLDYDDKPILAC